MATPGAISTEQETWKLSIPAPGAPLGRAAPVQIRMGQVAHAVSSWTRPVGHVSEDPEHGPRQIHRIKTMEAARPAPATERRGRCRPPSSSNCSRKGRGEKEVEQRWNMAHRVMGSPRVPSPLAVEAFPSAQRFPGHSCGRGARPSESAVWGPESVGSMPSRFGDARHAVLASQCRTPFRRRGGGGGGGGGGEGGGGGGRERERGGGGGRGDKPSRAARDVGSARHTARTTRCQAAP